MSKEWTVSFLIGIPTEVADITFIQRNADGKFNLLKNKLITMEHIERIIDRQQKQDLAEKKKPNRGGWTSEGGFKFKIKGGNKFRSGLFVIDPCI